MSLLKSHVLQPVPQGVRVETELGTQAVWFLSQCFLCDITVYRLANLIFFLFWPNIVPKVYLK